MMIYRGGSLPIELPHNELGLRHRSATVSGISVLILRVTTTRDNGEDGMDEPQRLWCVAETAEFL